MAYAIRAFGEIACTDEYDAGKFAGVEMLSEIYKDAGIAGTDAGKDAGIAGMQLG